MTELMTVPKIDTVESTDYSHKTIKKEQSPNGADEFVIFQTG